MPIIIGGNAHAGPDLLQEISCRILKYTGCAVSLPCWSSTQPGTSTRQARTSLRTTGPPMTPPSREASADGQKDCAGDECEGHDTDGSFRPSLVEASWGRETVGRQEAIECILCIVGKRQVVGICFRVIQDGSPPLSEVTAYVVVIGGKPFVLLPDDRLGLMLLQGIGHITAKQLKEVIVNPILDEVLGRSPPGN